MGHGLLFLCPGKEKAVGKRIEIDQAYENLANAIIESAVRDYKHALIYARNHPDNEHARREVKRQEQFFFSEWYETLTNLDPSYLVRKVRELVSRNERKEE